MYSWLKKSALSHRTWFSAGALCLGAAVVVGYHEDQLAANRVLAEKVGLPGEVMVQDFVPELHSNIADEVKILAEVGLAFATRVNAGDEAMPDWLDVVPVYPVSREAYPLALKRMNDATGMPRHPMPRYRAEDVRQDYAALKALENRPFGFLVHEAVDRKLASALRDGALGEGLNGPLVSVGGTIRPDAALIDGLVNAMSPRGIPVVSEMLVVSPYLNGRKASLLAPDYGWLRAALVRTGFAMFIVAFATMSPAFLSTRRKRRSGPVARVEAAGDFPAVGFFQPIRTQEELLDEDEILVRPRQATRVLSRLVARAGESLAPDGVRNQL